jgi:hypothetical protein
VGCLSAAPTPAGRATASLGLRAQLRPGRRSCSAAVHAAWSESRLSSACVQWSPPCASPGQDGSSANGTRPACRPQQWPCTEDAAGDAHRRRGRARLRLVSADQRVAARRKQRAGTVGERVHPEPRAVMRAAAARAMEPPLKQQQPATCRRREFAREREGGASRSARCSCGALAVPPAPLSAATAAHSTAPRAPAPSQRRVGADRQCVSLSM